MQINHFACMKRWELLAPVRQVFVASFRWFAERNSVGHQTRATPATDLLETVGRVRSSSDTAPMEVLQPAARSAERAGSSSSDTPVGTSPDIFLSRQAVSDADADEFVDNFLTWLLERGIAGPVEGGRLRELRDQFLSWSRYPFDLSEPVLFRALSRAGVTRKEKRISKSDPRYADMAKHRKEPKVMVYKLPEIPEPPEAGLRQLVFIEQGLSKPQRLAA